MSQAAAPAVNGSHVGRAGDPCAMVIFGAAGDLTRRKLMPALYNLGKHQPFVAQFCGDWGRAQRDDDRGVSRQALSKTCRNLWATISIPSCRHGLSATCIT
jgi:glucose-6-phosphate 1-dehydrogenase